MRLPPSRPFPYDYTRRAASRSGGESRGVVVGWNRRASGIPPRIERKGTKWTTLVPLLSIQQVLGLAMWREPSRCRHAAHAAPARQTHGTRPTAPRGPERRSARAKRTAPGPPCRVGRYGSHEAPSPRRIPGAGRSVRACPGMPAIAHLRHEKRPVCPGMPAIAHLRHNFTHCPSDSWQAPSIPSIITERSPAVIQTRDFMFRRHPTLSEI